MTKECFKIPSAEQVSEYGRQIGYRINGEQFVAFYESKGWLVGKSPMKNWRSAVVTWKIRASDNGGTGIFKPVPKETDSDRVARKIKAMECIQCLTGKIEFDEDRGQFRCRACNTDLTRYFK